MISKQNPILLYRGVPEHSDEKERVGRWWSTDPYYAYHYSSGGNGRLFVAQVQPEVLSELAKDVSIDEGYENYLFPDEDPAGARTASEEEIVALRSATMIVEHDDIPGGSMIQRPHNAVEIGYEIFGQKDIGAAALSETARVRELER